MKYLGSILSLIGGLIVVAAALASLISKDIGNLWGYEFSSTPGFVIVAAILAIMITILAFLSFSTKPRLLGSVIIAASFAGIIVGSTLTDIAMLFSTLGGIALYSSPLPKPKDELTKPLPGESDLPNPK
ncbi:MAG: hypothetical protein KBA54_00085 [Candidatus Cloacimonetes bacterium]|nr:hypothetical protein [Candidatus Cloacimonadota bacterium]